MATATDWWQPRPLGRSGVMTSRLGLGSSYGVGQRDVERAIDRGVTYLYWGSRRRDDFGRAITHAAKTRRDQLCVVVQSYSRSALALGPSVETALRKLKLDRADVLLLGWWNSPPPGRIMDKARALVESGKVRSIMVSCHNRPTFASYIADPAYDAIMVRYNAAHRGAEGEVFPHVVDALAHEHAAPCDGAAGASGPMAGRSGVRAGPPGVVAYTATRWGALLDKSLVPAGEAVPRASDCYRFALTRPEVDVVIAGPANGAELDEALAALDRGPMSEDELAWMRRVGDGVKQMSTTDAARTRNTGALWERAVGAAQKLAERFRT